MKKTNLEGHKPLVQLINYFLFQRFTPPKIRKDSTYKIGDQLISHIDSIRDGNRLVDSQSAVEYFELQCKNFVSKLNKSERFNLLKCYGTSDITAFNNLLSSVHPEMIKEFDFKANNDFKESKVAHALIYDKSISGEIDLYLKVHFAELLSFIPLQTDRISEIEYIKIITNFGENLSSANILQKIVPNY